ncbi:MAG: hypothetical protein QXJ59_08900 [Thermofilaceae archaeon]
MEAMERMARPYRYEVKSRRVDFKLLRDSWDLKPLSQGCTKVLSEEGFSIIKVSSKGELTGVTIRVGKGMGE